MSQNFYNKAFLKNSQSVDCKIHSQCKVTQMVTSYGTGYAVLHVTFKPGRRA